MSVAVGMGHTAFAASGWANHRDAAATESERTYALFVNLAGLAGFVSVPVVPTLVLWAIKKGDSPFIDDHGREAMNAQISYIIYALAMAALAPITCGVTLAGLAVLPIVAIVCVIRAAIAANRGEYHRYPITLRLIH